MARLFQELKLNFDTDEQIADHTSHRFNLLMRTNSCRKIIGIYFNGYTMTNTKHWALYYCRYRAMKILNKKKYQDYTKKVYIDISEPEAQSFHLRSHNMSDIVCIDGTYDDEDGENVQAFTHCPICKTLCVISGGDKNKNDQLHKYGMCHTCWRNLFSVSN